MAAESSDPVHEPRPPDTVSGIEHWNLIDLPAPDGVRSPTVLFSGEGARAVLLHLAAGQELGEHQVRERAWVTVVDGLVEVECDGERFDATVGELVTFAPGERHSVRSQDGARILLVLAPWPAEGHYPPESA
jgi:quercetin dioxygenase-like cupin family protein